ncbi:hypothetical protein COLO4_36458 [Corchorus olitorius]|uniref:Uncharacterized protein n=1 Tax=Corchorus olitorius TaxID=93759 RepID=A0A1R3G8T9_9ROSI|nr:hypothetical protein COLO4_36458 [Corchorus olitorius]
MAERMGFFDGGRSFEIMAVKRNPGKTMDPIPTNNHPQNSVVLVLLPLFILSPGTAIDDSSVNESPDNVEDQAVNISAQEQIHLSTIQTMQNELLSAKSETKQLGEDTEKMLRVKGQICSQITAKQRKIASLESDSSTLTQFISLIM